MTADTPAWDGVKKALWRVIMDAEINGKYIAAFPLVEKLHAAAIEAILADRAARIQAEREAVREAVCSLLAAHVYSSGGDGPYLRPEPNATHDVHHRTIIAAISALDLGTNGALAQAITAAEARGMERAAVISENSKKPDGQDIADEIRSAINPPQGGAGHE